MERLEGRVLLAGNLQIDGHSAVLPFESPALSDSYAAVAMQTDGKYVFAARNSVNTNRLVVVRLNADGTLDNTFGTGGRSSVLLSGATSVVPSTIGFQSNGKLLIGTTISGSPNIVRLTSAGAIDTTFDTDGRITAPFAASTMVIQSNDAIVIGGSLSSQIAVARFTSSGALDTTFSADGIANISAGTSSSATSIVI